MLGLIIFGTRGVTSNRGHGKFFCPQCGEEKGFARKRVRRFFTLYFIPVVPLNLLGEYVECRGCRGTFRPDVLDYDPEAQGAAMEAEFQRAVRRVMVQMVMADGVVDDDEVARLRQVYAQVSGRTVSADAVRKEIRAVEQDRRGLLAYLKDMEPWLNERGKELVVSAALQVAYADGSLHEDERRLVSQIAGALGVGTPRLRALAEEATRAR